MSSILVNPRERSRFLHFAVVGIIGAVVDFGIMNLLTRLAGVSLVVAGTISFICAILSNFLWNRYWTYPDSRSKPVYQQLITFSVVSVSGLIIRIPILALVEPLMYKLLSALPYKIPYFSTKALGDNITLAVAVGIVMFWNFFANRYWTYNDVE